MRIVLRCDPSRLLRWNLWVAQSLAEMPGNEIFLSFSTHRRPLPPSCRMLVEFERLIFGSRGDGATDPIEDQLRMFPPHPGGEIDVLVDFSGGGILPAAGRVLTPSFNGVPGEVGTMAALAGDQELLVELYDTARPAEPWRAHPASADRELFSASLDGVLACAAELIAKAIRVGARVGSGPDLPMPRGVTSPALSVLCLAHAARMSARKATKLLDVLLRRGSSWTIGWRLDETASLLDKGEAAFQVLTGGGESYVADPFPFRHQSQNYIFLELFPYASNRGCIAVATVERNGMVSTPRIVLEEPHHLSYPFVFEHSGEIWMIPESGASRSVYLYKAEPFPHRWTRVACLAEGLEAYDVTPLFQRDKLWFFASLRSWKSTAWDMLGLYRAEGLTKPWRAHFKNPVTIDAACSRPAGALFQRGEWLLRPVQDCSRFYGGGLTFFRVDALNNLTFEQTPVGRIVAGTSGCHTYNRHHGLEVIDLFGRFREGQETSIAYQPTNPC
ncbi:glucosamine inositolphosphorylceramide transferase family protein [Aurantimonas endophytica]|uniref:Glucosamine inositolphosphorylceramide transferase 1 N-terminal domain-containing protein n=1 Tax=Aurantimonas endophytica TaxID=1522175 RepID=A0A7W6HFX5_9HYPH|nr:hypothetical protein [Aurantimonas endophytica]MBB4004403.1 hypothetical protein [Aurantimonas endophytica]MCO6405241.1 hypothetical protein [Aurantimonas endophytica]